MTPLEGFLRAAEHVPPNVFFREMLRRFGPGSIQRQDVDRALFLFDRVQRARERLCLAMISLAAGLAVPVGSFFVTDAFRWPAFLGGVGAETLVVVFFSSAHRSLMQRRNDYQTWLAVVHRVARSRSPGRGPDDGLRR